MGKTEEFDKLLTEKVTADLLNVSISFLRKARIRYGLPYYKLGPSKKALVKFRLSEVEVWLKQRKHAG